jgi:hypothetical protein
MVLCLFLPSISLIVPLRLYWAKTFRAFSTLYFAAFREKNDQTFLIVLMIETSMFIIQNLLAAGKFIIRHLNGRARVYVKRLLFASIDIKNAVFRKS